MFVNNASFGADAEVVQSPAYGDDKAGTTLQILPGLLSGHQGAHLVVRADGRVILDGPQAVLVSNNPHEGGDLAGLGRRARLDQSVLGVVGVKVENAAQAAGLLHKGQRSRELTAHEVIIDADQPQIPVGIDGESVLMPTPGPLHDPPAGAAGTGAAQPARRPAAAAAGELGTAARAGRGRRPRRTTGHFLISISGLVLPGR